MSEAERTGDEERGAGDEGGTQGNEEPTSMSNQAVSKTDKITVLFMATGSAPIMKQSKWCVEHTRTISSLVSFLHKYLSLKPSESLFLYVNKSFAPSQDQDQQFPIFILTLLKTHVINQYDHKNEVLSTFYHTDTFPIV